MKSQIDNRIYGFEDQNNGNGRSSESRQARLDGRVVTDEDKVNKWLMAALLAFSLLWLGHGRAGAQIASSNPLEYVALGVCSPCRGQ